jgi:DNA-binding response OmpR family regulator
MHLLLVSDQTAEARILATSLERASISSRVLPMAAHVGEMLVLAARQPGTAIAIDAADMAGAVLPLLRRLRNEGVEAPIVVLARGKARNAEVDAFNYGADALVLRETAALTLPAHLAAIRRRLERRRTPALRCGNVTLDCAAGLLTVNGRPVEVTAGELNVLEALLSAQHVTLDKDLLGEHLQRAGLDQGAGILRVLVCRVRRKLAAHGADDIIQTVWGVGYRAEPPARQAAARAGREAVQQLAA